MNMEHDNDFSTSCAKVDDSMRDSGGQAKVDNEPALSERTMQNQESNGIPKPSSDHKKSDLESLMQNNSQMSEKITKYKEFRSRLHHPSEYLLESNIQKSFRNTHKSDAGMKRDLRENSSHERKSMPPLIEISFSQFDLMIEKRMICRIREINSNPLYKDLSIEEKKEMMKSNVPLNLIRQFEKKEESEGSEHEEVKKSEIDLMKTSVADLNKSLSTFRRSFVNFTSNKKLPRSISPSRRDPSADNKKIGRASAMKDRTPPSRDLKVGQNAFSNPDLERGSRGTIQRARAGGNFPVSSL
ncbi:unnamed protein product [Moneuplotes crassus]|uniref:Uncharacterized protein n=1 Tax=Euplotes crassus TaxID=5936 RepID=A0AAD1YAV5_EUPCR|nr:unnamed protein product [Moneuplotes crassus]